MSTPGRAEIATAPALSVETWAERDEDEGGELFDGQLVEEEMPTHAHEQVVAWLMFVLGAWAKTHGAFVFGSEHKLGIASGRGRKPDVSLYLAGTRLGRGASVSKQPPHVVIEVVSPRPRDVHRDRIDKLADYAVFGVPFYWVIDPRTRLVEMLELDGRGRYGIAVSAAGGSVDGLGCAGLRLDLDELWRDIDRLVEEGDGEAE